MGLCGGVDELHKCPGYPRHLIVKHRLKGQGNCSWPFGELRLLQHRDQMRMKSKRGFLFEIIVTLWVNAINK